MTLQEFITKYNGQGIDFDNFAGFQCVDLMNQYLKEVLSVQNPISVFPGATAYEIYENANSPLFTKIANTPDNIPSPGDIIFWNTSIGSAGHVAIFVSGDANSFISFDQNWPTGSLCHEETHDYNGVAGWLSFNQASSMIYRGLDLTNVDSMKVAIDVWDAVVNQGLYVKKDQYTTLESQLKSATDHSTALQGQLDNATTDVGTLQSQLKDTQSKYDEVSKELTQTNGSLSSLTSSNYEYSAKAYQSESLANDRLSYIHAMTDALQVSTTQDDKALVEEALNEIAALRKNQKTTEGDYSPATTLSLWEEHFKTIIDYAISHGLNEWLKLSNLQIVDLEGNPQDETVADKFKTFLDEKMGRLDFLEQAQEKITEKVAKARPFLVNLNESLYGFGVKIGLLVTKQPD